MKISFLILGISLAGFSHHAFGANADNAFVLDDKNPTEVREHFHFATLPEHHFNEQAPNRVESLKGKDWVAADILMEGPAVEATFSEQINPCHGLRARLFVCDDKNTYCLPKAVQYTCNDTKLIAQEWKDAPSENVGKVQTDEKKVFITNDPDRALHLASTLHKPLLIDFFAVWCPPCNQLDELVFSSDEFQKLGKNFVLLRLDVDASVSFNLKSKYKVGGYPTIVFADDSADEISRIVGFREKKDFLAEMTTALTNKAQGIEKKKVLAEKNTKAAYELGLTFLDRHDYYQAHYYLFRASRSWSIADIRRNKLLSAVLGIHEKAESNPGRRIYLEFLERALDWYPRQIEVFDRALALAKVAQDLKDKDAEKKAYLVTIDTARWYLAHPKAWRGSEWTRGDFYEALGDSFEKLDRKQESLDAFSSGAAAYLEDIKKSGLNEDTERGFNLERLYCLWKSGHIDEAQTLYAKFEGVYPNDFTFFLQHARLLKELKKFGEAEGKAQKAYELSYGDNKLRAAKVLAQIFDAENKKSLALHVIDDATHGVDLPEDEDLRTRNYYDALIDLKREIHDGK